MIGYNHQGSCERMRFISNTCIKIDRELSDLDHFALDFTMILKKHASYVIVSGYVAILLGRSRGSEGIDIIIPKIDFSTFQSLFLDLKRNGFYCLNAEQEKDIFEYLVDGLAVRFAKKDTVIPNIEMKWVKNKFDDLALKKRVVVNVSSKELYISHLEMQIAFKEAVLKSPKDIEDARHMRRVAKGYIDESVIQQYKEQLHEFFYPRKSKRTV